MQSTGSERRGLIVLLSIIAILIVTALLTGFFRSRGATAIVPSDTSIVITTVRPKQPSNRTDTTATTKRRRRTSTKPASARSERQYRQRDFYEETLDR